jgi:hypothetical protein
MMMLEILFPHGDDIVISICDHHKTPDRILRLTALTHAFALRNGR